MVFESDYVIISESGSIYHLKFKNTEAEGERSNVRINQLLSKSSFNNIKKEPLCGVGDAVADKLIFLNKEKKKYEIKEGHLEKAVGKKLFFRKMGMSSRIILVIKSKEIYK